MRTVPYCAVFWAEQHINASLTALLFASFPLVVAIWNPVLANTMSLAAKSRKRIEFWMQPKVRATH